MAFVSIAWCAAAEYCLFSISLFNDLNDNATIALNFESRYYFHSKKHKQESKSSSDICLTVNEKQGRSGAWGRQNMCDQTRGFRKDFGKSYLLIYFIVPGYIFV